MSGDLSRRGFLRGGAGALGLGVLGQAAIVRPAFAAGADDFGPLQPPDANGVMLPVGFTSRVVATTGQVVPGTSYTWHGAPDGGAVYATGDGGWVYVSNSELGAGGVGALRFDAAGDVVDAYSILTGTSTNCAGGPTPWNTWLSCEEHTAGRAYECDPFSASQGSVRLGLGTFKHEAAAVDPAGENVYLTEDRPDGLLYRSSHTAWPDLSTGTLEALEILDPGGDGDIAPGEVRGVTWHPIAEANPANGGIQNDTHLPLAERATRYQQPDATPFNGGEGCWLAEGVLYFATKGNSRIWKLDLGAQTIEILYDWATTPPAQRLLAGVDNVYVSPEGDVYVAEDGGNMEIVALTPSGGVIPILRLPNVSGSEITGPALSPDGTRLYFSSQRNPGETFEVRGPFTSSQPAPTLGGVGSLVLAGALGALAAFATLRSEDPDAR